MALDFTPIQASTVPSKHVFSSSAEMDMKKWNHIDPVLMEALQMLKFALKQSCLDFTKGGLHQNQCCKNRSLSFARTFSVISLDLIQKMLSIILSSSLARMTLMIWTLPEHSITHALPFHVCISCSLCRSQMFNCFCASVCLHSPIAYLICQTSHIGSPIS